MSPALLVALALALNPGPQRFDLAPKEDGWEQVRDQDGVQVFTKAIPGSSVYGLRSTGLIDAPVVQVARLLLDSKHMAQWVERLAEGAGIDVGADAGVVGFEAGEKTGAGGGALRGVAERVSELRRARADTLVVGEIHGTREEGRFLVRHEDQDVGPGLLLCRERQR